MFDQQLPPSAFMSTTASTHDVQPNIGFSVSSAMFDQQLPSASMSATASTHGVQPNNEFSVSSAMYAQQPSIAPMISAPCVSSSGCASGAALPPANMMSTNMAFAQQPSSAPMSAAATHLLNHDAYQAGNSPGQSFSQPLTSSWQNYASQFFEGGNHAQDHHRQMIQAPLERAPNNDFATSQFGNLSRRAQANEGNYNGRGGFAMQTSSNLFQPSNQDTALFGNLESVLESGCGSEEVEVGDGLRCEKNKFD